MDDPIRGLGTVDAVVCAILLRDWGVKDVTVRALAAATGKSAYRIRWCVGKLQGAGLVTVSHDVVTPTEKLLEIGQAA